MAFTVDDFHDLLRLLEAHPDWKQELRRVVLTDELLTLPALVRDLIAAQERTEARVEALAAAQERTEARVEALAAAQERTEARVKALAAAQERTEARVEALAAAQQRTEARVEALAAAQQRTEARLEELAAAQVQTEARLAALTARVEELVTAYHRLDDHVGAIRGDLLEIRFRERGAAALAQLGFRQVRILPGAEWVDMVDAAYDAGRLSAAERLDLLRLDAVVRARDAAGEVWLAVEVSTTGDVHDVTRAQARAAVLAKLDGRARPVVASHRFTAGAQARQKSQPDLVLVTLRERSPRSGERD